MLTKFMVEDGPLTLETNDLIDVRTKLGFCLVGYITEKFPGIKALRALSQSWGASFQLHDSGWLIFRFARAEDKQTVVRYRQRTNLKQQQPAKAVQQPDAITDSTKQTQTAEQQPTTTATPRIPRPAVVETESEAGSSGSSNDQIPGIDTTLHTGLSIRSSSERSKIETATWRGPPSSVPMKIGFWNVRGLNRPLKQNRVAHLIKNNRLYLLGILETKLAATAIPKIINRLFSGWCQANNFDAIAGGCILIIWNPAVIGLHLEDISPQKEHVGETFGIGAAVETLQIVALHLVFMMLKLPDVTTLDHPNFIPTVEERWGLNMEGTPQFRLCRKLKALKSSLKASNAQTHLESYPRDVAVRDSLGDLRKKATFLTEAERHFYYQKAKIHFLKQGDRNTKFFHDMVKRNAARNSTLAITKADGSIISSAPDIAQEFIEFYTSLLGIKDQTLPIDDGVFHWGPCSLRSLPRTFVGQSHRQRAVMDFFRSGRMLRQLNHTIIALVPKSEHSPSVADYRSISCCNVIYKVITKIIADRLSPALEQLIDSSQAAFVGGRNITDNIFLAQEMVRQYSRKRISPHFTINIDLQKAFDSVSWTFLSRVPHGYSFPQLFISWIMECVSITSFLVVLNGSLHRHFPGKKCLSDSQPQITRRLWTRLQPVFANGRPSPYLSPAGWSLYAPLSREWSAFGSKSSLSQWQLLKRSIVCAGPSYGIPREHWWPGRIFVIRRRKVVWVSGISNPKILLSLLESYETFIARQTPYGPNAAIQHMAEWTDSNGLVMSKAYEYSGRSFQGNPGKLQFRRHSYRLNTHSFCGLDYGRVVWHHPTYVNPSQCSKVAQEREDRLLCAEQSAASRFGMHGLQPLEAPQ
ncbi:hypothetical protein Sango_2050200 [Sesamum angolense]|uniref:Reverse transcriptase domain-containing protein n=1 Tax=Sesamum angolense TaxID=2727404 RepID=A0AAE1WFU8_9LAMI|nr:hypothetical protein Sango_2050200 [Sesamum angolense]